MNSFVQPFEWGHTIMKCHNKKNNYVTFSLTTLTTSFFSIWYLVRFFFLILSTFSLMFLADNNLNYLHFWPSICTRCVSWKRCRVCVMFGGETIWLASSSLYSRADWAAMAALILCIADTWQLAAHWTTFKSSVTTSHHHVGCIRNGKQFPLGFIGTCFLLWRQFSTCFR